MILHVSREGCRRARAPVWVLSIVILFGPSTVTFAAKEKKTAEDWPPITQAERDLKRVEQDPEADAVILYTERSGRIMKRADDTVNVMNFQWRLKVLTDRGKR